MTTLADINESLIKQTQVLGAKQTYTSGRVDELINSFDKAFKPKFSGDDLEDRYEGRGGVATIEPDDNNNDNSKESNANNETKEEIEESDRLITLMEPGDAIQIARSKLPARSEEKKEKS